MRYWFFFFFNFIRGHFLCPRVHMFFASVYQSGTILNSFKYLNFGTWHVKWILAFLEFWHFKWHVVLISPWCNIKTHTGNIPGCQYLFRRQFEKGWTITLYFLFSFFCQPMSSRSLGIFLLVSTPWVHPVIVPLFCNWHSVKSVAQLLNVVQTLSENVGSVTS